MKFPQLNVITSYSIHYTKLYEFCAAGGGTIVYDGGTAGGTQNLIGETSPPSFNNLVFRGAGTKQISKGIDA